MWLVGASQQMIFPLFNVLGWKVVREFSHKTKNIMNIMGMCSNRGGGWEIYWSTKKVSVLYHSVWKYFDDLAAT